MVTRPLFTPSFLTPGICHLLMTYLRRSERSAQRWEGRKEQRLRRVTERAEMEEPTGREAISKAECDADEQA